MLDLSSPDFSCYKTILAFLSSQGNLSINSSLASEKSYSSLDVYVKQSRKEWRSSTGHRAWRHILFSGLTNWTQSHSTSVLREKCSFFPSTAKKNPTVSSWEMSEIKFWVLINQGNYARFFFYPETPPPLASHLQHYLIGNTTTKQNNLLFPTLALDATEQQNWTDQKS